MAPGLSKSKYTPGPGPKSETRTYQLTGEGIRAVIVRTHKDGRVETIEYGADYDSVNHVIGTPDYDAVQLTRINAYVSEATLSHAGKQFGTARREIAKDGMTMVITFQQDSQTRIHNVAHYVKKWRRRSVRGCPGPRRIGRTIVGPTAAGGVE